MKKFVLAIIALLLMPSMVLAASLSIDEKSYDKESRIFTIGGDSTYSEVMVSLFDGDELLSFKTVSASGNKYNATFEIEFTENKTITIKVGDINSTDYKIATLDVEKSTDAKKNKLTDDGGNSLTVLDKLKSFAKDDRLELDIQTDFSSANSEEKALIEALQKALGVKRDFVGVMIISVADKNGAPVELQTITDGYELFLNVSKEDLSAFKKPMLVSLDDEIEFKFGTPKELVYDDSTKGVTVKLDKVGIYILYDDISINYSFLDKTDNQSYNVKKGGTITFKVDADYDKFVALYIDDKLVDKANYTVAKGSTVITLKEDYAKTLDNGSHKVRIDFTDGEANTELNIVATNVVVNPKTGDAIVTFIALGILSISGIAFLAKKKKLS